MGLMHFGLPKVEPVDSLKSNLQASHTVLVSGRELCKEGYIFVGVGLRHKSLGCCELTTDAIVAGHLTGQGSIL